MFMVVLLPRDAIDNAASKYRGRPSDAKGKVVNFIQTPLSLALYMINVGARTPASGSTGD
jgi:hypothetical protein